MPLPTNTAVPRTTATCPVAPLPREQAMVNIFTPVPSHLLVGLRFSIHLVLARVVLVRRASDNEPRAGHLWSPEPCSASRSKNRSKPTSRRRGRESVARGKGGAQSRVLRYIPSRRGHAKSWEHTRKKKVRCLLDAACGSAGNQERVNSSHGPASESSAACVKQGGAVLASSARCSRHKCVNVFVPLVLPTHGAGAASHSLLPVRPHAQLVLNTRHGKCVWRRLLQVRAASTHPHRTT